MPARNVCVVRSLSKLAWRYFWSMEQGQSLEALASLEVFRRLYSEERAGILELVPEANRSLIPPALSSTSYDENLRRALLVAMGLALGNVAPQLSARLQALPANANQVGAWFAQTRDLAPSSVADSLRDYWDIPLVVGSGAQMEALISRTVAQDVADCMNPPAAQPAAQPAPAPAPTPAPTPSVVLPNISLPTTVYVPAPVQASGGTRSGSSGGGAVILLALGVAIYFWMRQR